MYKPACPTDDKRPLEAKEQYRMELAELTPLTVSEELALIKLARAGNQDAAWMILESCLPYVAKVANKHARMAQLDPLDVAQAGNTRMVECVYDALETRYPPAYLRVVAKHALIRYCIESTPIRVPYSSYSRGKRAPRVISIDAPILHRENVTLHDLVEA